MNKSETKQIRVGEISDGPLTAGEPGTSVSLPVDDVLTGHGFITGKSGLGKSNTASVSSSDSSRGTAAVSSSTRTASTTA